MTHRTAARLVAILFITATVSFTLAVVLLEPVVGTSNYLAQVAVNEGRVRLGVLLELANHVSVVGISVVIYPVLRRFSERLALGYVAARSIEAVLFVIGTMHLLALLSLSHDYLAAGSPSSSHFQTLGDMLLAGHDWDDAPLAFTAFGISALILNYALYQARLVPRWLSVFGLVAAASILAARGLLMAGTELSSGVVMTLDSPIMLQEMVFAVWLLARGFEPDAFGEIEKPGG